MLNCCRSLDDLFGRAGMVAGTTFYNDTYERTPSLQKQPYVVFKLARNRSSRQSCTDAAARFVSVAAFSYRGPHHVGDQKALQ